MVAPFDMKPKFTPGPWHFSADYGAVVSDVINDSGETDIICTFDAADDASDAEIEGNAHLIAAAPELLEMTALLERFLVYEIKNSDRDGDDEGANLKSFTLAQVRGALAKARGEPRSRRNPHRRGSGIVSKPTRLLRTEGAGR